MKNQDLELAKLKLTEENVSLVITKNGKVIFKTRKQGVSGFLDAIEKMHTELLEASVADKIVGVAVAMLCIYSGISSVFALTISEGGIKVLKDSDVTCLFENKVAYILNRNKTDVCPFEQLAMTSETAKEAYMKMKSKVSQSDRKSTKNNC